MTTMQGLFTRTDYNKLPEGFPAELIEGCLVKQPSSTYGHQSLQMRLLRMLVPLVPDGLLISAPTDVAIDEVNVFQPDIVVLAQPPARSDQSYVGTPSFVIEVLSPSTAERDRTIKAHRLLEIGVQEVWLVDPEAQTVELRATGSCRTAVGDESLRSVVVAGFEVVPSRLFAR